MHDFGTHFQYIRSVWIYRAPQKRGRQSCKSGSEMGSEMGGFSHFWGVFRPVWGWSTDPVWQAKGLVKPENAQYSGCLPCTVQRLPTMCSQGVQMGPNDPPRGAKKDQIYPPRGAKRTRFTLQEGAKWTNFTLREGAKWTNLPSEGCQNAEITLREVPNGQFYPPRVPECQK